MRSEIFPRALPLPPRPFIWLVVLLWMVVPMALANDLSCTFSNHNRMGLKAPAGSEQDKPRVFTVVETPDGRAEAKIECHFASGVDPRKFLNIPKGQYPNVIITGVDHGRALKENSRSEAHWFVPVVEGNNRYVIHYGAHPPIAGAGEVVREITLKAWRYGPEAWGQIEWPYPAGSKDARLRVTASDEAGNLYARYEYRRSNDKRVAGLVRFASGGRIAARYQVSGNGTEREDDSAVGHPVGVDDKGNLYAVVSNNLVQFNAAGKFARSIGAFGGRKKALGLVDLDKWTSDEKTPWARYAAPGDYAWPTLKGAMYLLLNTNSGYPGAYGHDKSHLVRLGFDGRLEPLATVGGEGTPYQLVYGGLVAGPDGNLYIAAQKGQEWVVQVFTTDGKPVRVMAGNDLGADPRKRQSWTQIIGMLGDGTVVDSSSVRRTWDHTQVSHTAPFWREWSRMMNPGQVEKYDLLTNAPVAQRAAEGGYISVNVAPSAQWVHAGRLYYLYQDGRVARFIPRSGAPAERGGQAVRKPEAQLSVMRLEGDFSLGVALDGQTPVKWVAKLVDDTQNPLAGVPVRLAVVETDLPARGRFEQLGERTGADGQVTGVYLPPKVTPDQAGRRLIYVNFQASAKGSSGEAVEANENVRAMAVRNAFLRVSHPGLATADPLPFALSPNAGQAISGQAVFRPPLRGFDSRYTTATRNEYPLAYAQVDLLDQDGKTVLAGAQSDPYGSFRLEYRSDRDKGGPPNEIRLPAALALTGYAPDVADLVQRATEAFRKLEQAERGFDTARLQGALQALFPERVAAGDAEETARQITILERMAMLAVAVSVTQDLSNHAADQFVDSLGSVVSNLLKLYKVEPVEMLKSETGGVDTIAGLATSAQAREQAMLARLPADKVATLSLLRKMQSYVLHRLLEQLARKEGAQAVQTAYEATVWAVAKDAITELLSGWLSDSTHWRNKLAAPITGSFRKRAQDHLQEAGKAWAEGTVASKGSVGSTLRTRYSELAEHKSKVSAAQYSLDLYKADIDLGFSLGGNAVKIFAGLTASPAGAKAANEGVEILERFYTLVSTGLDAYMGYNWLGDFQAGQEMLDDIARNAIRMNIHCFGDGC